MSVYNKGNINFSKRNTWAVFISRQELTEKDEGYLPITFRKVFLCFEFVLTQLLFEFIRWQTVCLTIVDLNQKWFKRKALKSFSQF